MMRVLSWLSGLQFKDPVDSLGKGLHSYYRGCYHSLHMWLQLCYESRGPVLAMVDEGCCAFLGSQARSASTAMLLLVLEDMSALANKTALPMPSHFCSSS